MVEDIIQALDQIGPAVGIDKTRWTSPPPVPQDTLDVRGTAIAWAPSPTFVGPVVDLGGSSGPAEVYRM
eukprot:11384080-Alexandrium_andersonii.AAC.1